MQKKLLACSAECKINKQKPNKLECFVSVCWSNFYFASFYFVVLLSSLAAELKF